MIELCSKKRMLLSIAGLGLVSILIIILESKHLRAHEVDIHERYGTPLQPHHGPYTERIDLWFDASFVKEIRRVSKWLQEIKRLTNQEQHLL